MIAPKIEHGNINIYNVGMSYHIAFISRVECKSGLRGKETWHQQTSETTRQHDNATK